MLLRNTRELKTVICEQNSTEKKKITEKSLRDANKNGFGNDVGKITNRCTAMYDVLAKFEKDTPEYKEMEYRIICMQGYQQEIIDSCKGIIPKQVPKEWYDYKAVKILDDDTEEVRKQKEHNLSLLANKKPYFFIYNYSHLKNDYNKYVKNNKDKCIAIFGKTFDELINENNKTLEEEIFINGYNNSIPVSDAPSTMNKICHMLEEEFNNILKPIKDSKFDISIFTTDRKVKKSEIDKFNDIYKEYKSEYKKIFNNKNKNKKDINQGNERIFIDYFKDKLEETFNSDYEIICNVMVTELYNKNVSKQIVWDICGSYMIDLLLNKNNNKINIPIENINGSIEWNGYNYTLEEREVKC